MSDLGAALLPETKSSVISGLAQQETLAVDDITTLLTSAEELYTKFDATTEEGYIQTDTITATQINALSNNKGVLTSLEVATVEKPYTTLISSESDRKTAIEDTSKGNKVFTAKATTV